MAHKDVTPGPKYDLSNVTHRGPVTPAGCLMTFKHKPRRASLTPSPAEYKVHHVVKNRPPEYSMGTKRHEQKNPNQTPAPNAYSMASTLGKHLPNLSSAPEYSMLGRDAGRTAVKSVTPGPAGYPAVDVALSRPQAPYAVITGRSPVRRSRVTCTPAPNAYLPGPGGSRYARAPQVYMSGRYERKAGPYLAAADRLPDWE